MFRRKSRGYEKVTDSASNTNKQKKATRDIDWQLVKAAHEGDTNKAEAALKNGANPNHTMTVAYFATCQPHSSQTWLPEHTFIVDTCKVADEVAPTYTNKTTSPLYLAVNNNDKVMVELLTRSGATADINCEPISDDILLHPGQVDKPLPSTETALHAATRLNHDSCLESLLLNKKTHINGKDATGDTALLIATKLSRRHLTNKLLTAGASIRSKDYQGNTVLHIAATMNLNEMAGDFLKHANTFDNAKLKKNFINLTNKDGVTALQIAMSNRNQDLIDTLLHQGASVKGIKLEAAINAGATRIIAKILTNASEKKCAKILSKTNKQGMSPLAIAINLGDEKVVKELLNYGAPITEKELAIANNQPNEQVKSLLADRTDTSLLAASSRLFQAKSPARPGSARKLSKIGRKNRQEPGLLDTDFSTSSIRASQ